MIFPGSSRSTVNCGRINPELEPDAAREAFSDLTARNDVHILVCDIGHALVATCMLVIIPNLASGAQALCGHRTRRPLSARRSRGYGRRVLEHALDLAWSRQCCNACSYPARSAQRRIGSTSQLASWVMLKVTRGQTKIPRYSFANDQTVQQWRFACRSPVVMVSVGPRIMPRLLFASKIASTVT